MFSVIQYQLYCLLHQVVRLKPVLHPLPKCSQFTWVDPDLAYFLLLEMKTKTQCHRYSVGFSQPIKSVFLEFLLSIYDFGRYFETGYDFGRYFETGRPRQIIKMDSFFFDHQSRPCKLSIPLTKELSIPLTKEQSLVILPLLLLRKAWVIQLGRKKVEHYWVLQVTIRYIISFKREM